jgi:hypothetical protein
VFSKVLISKNKVLPIPYGQESNVLNVINQTLVGKKRLSQDLMSNSVKLEQELTYQLLMSKNWYS